MNINNIIKKDVVYVDMDANIKEVARKMKRNKVKYILVLDQNRAEGIITITDLVYRVIAEGKDYDVKAKDVMSRPLIVIFPETTLEEVVEAFKQHDIRRLIVIDKNDGRLIGVVEKDDVFKIISNFNK